MNAKSLSHTTVARRRHQVNLRLERWHRWCVYLSLAWLVLTGLLFLIASYFLRSPGEFGQMPHPLEHFSMRLHGGGAMVTLFFFGSLMNSHIRRALKSGRNLYTGWLMIGSLAVLITTGYGLYYFADESSRQIWSLLHWIVGLSLAVVFICHIYFGRRSRSA